MDGDFNVKFDGDFDSLAKSVQSSSVDEFKEKAQEAFNKIREGGGSWSLESKDGGTSFTFTGDPDAIKREFGTTTGAGTYAVNRAMRSTFGNAIQYIPDQDHALFQKSLSDTSHQEKLVKKVGVINLNTEQDRKAMLKNIVLKKAANVTNASSLDAAINSLFKNSHFSRFQKSVYALLLWEGRRYWGLENQKLRYEDALVIQGMMLLTPNSLTAWKESLFLTVLGRALHQGAKQDVFNVNAYSILLNLVVKTEVIGKGGKTLIEGSLPRYAQAPEVVIDPTAIKYTDAQGFTHYATPTLRNIMDFEKQGRIKGGGIVGRARIKHK